GSLLNNNWNYSIVSLSSTSGVNRLVDVFMLKYYDASRDARTTKNIHKSNVKNTSDLQDAFFHLGGHLLICCNQAIFSK
ncbi:MAG: hypothetical protein M0Q94_06125, partial [Candidatus Cloacimonetes bacterium]|nr:hypothetical protein [Candidatus Cloacimonadota bacterium]